MTNPIPPTIGRVVLVRFSAPGPEGDVPAIVNAVHSNEGVSTCAMPFGSTPYPVTSIVYAEDHEASGQSVSWHWMDYQLSVAGVPYAHDGLEHKNEGLADHPDDVK